jgi:hypothetical protein
MARLWESPIGFARPVTAEALPLCPISPGRFGRRLATGSRGGASLENNAQKRTARYANIPDHSDLRGFSYRAPMNYQWSDDHRGSSGREEEDLTPREGLWHNLKFFGKGPRNYRRSDERIREDACEALLQHPGIDASGMEVSVTGGVVTLLGSVPSPWMKRASGWVIEEVSGVRDVDNKLKVA